MRRGSGSESSPLRLSFLVPPSPVPSRVRLSTFAIIRPNASSRSMPSRLAMQISTKRMSAISMREVALGLVLLLGLLAEAVVDLAGQLAHLLGQPGEVGERMEVALLELADPGIDAALILGERHDFGCRGVVDNRVHPSQTNAPEVTLSLGGCAPSAAISARMNWGRSAGVREEIRFPSTTTGLSSQCMPAFTRSSLMAPTLVPRLPRTMPAEIGTHPAWQMKATGFPASKISRVSCSSLGERRMMSGA